MKSGWSVLRVLAPIAAGAALTSGCGLGETAVGAAAEGRARVEEVRAAQSLKAKVNDDLARAAATDGARRAAAEADSQ
jgi:hypothetical protein